MFAETAGHPHLGARPTTELVERARAKSGCDAAKLPGRVIDELLLIDVVATRLQLGVARLAQPANADADILTLLVCSGSGSGQGGCYGYKL